MKRWRHLALVVVLCAAGCSSSNPTEPGPGPGTGDEHEPNDFAAQPLGALSSTDIVVHGSTATGSDVDLFSVTAGAAVNLFANLAWSTSSFLELTLSNQNGTFVRNLGGANPETCTLSLPAGTYTVRVGTLTDGATNYTLTLGQR